MNIMRRTHFCPFPELSFKAAPTFHMFAPSVSLQVCLCSEAEKMHKVEMKNMETTIDLKVFE